MPYCSNVLCNEQAQPGAEFCGGSACARRYASKGAANRDEALVRVTRGKGEYIADANRALFALIKAGGPFTSDDIVEMIGKHEDEGRVLGSVLRGAARRCLIQPTGKWIKSTDPSCNVRDKREWIAWKDG